MMCVVNSLAASDHICSSTLSNDDSKRAGAIPGRGWSHSRVFDLSAFITLLTALGLLLVC